MILTISGPIVPLVDYFRIPMSDMAGLKYSAFVHHNYTEYRPLGGSNEVREYRAKLIADSQGGKVTSSPSGNGMIVYFARVENLEWAKS